jgi:hypothetical protein
MNITPGGVIRYKMESNIFDDDQLFVNSWIAFPNPSTSQLTTYKYFDSTVTIAKKYFTLIITEVSNTNLFPIFKEIFNDLKVDPFPSIRIANNTYLGYTQFKLCEDLINNGYYLFLYYYADPGQTLVHIPSMEQLLYYLAPHNSQLGKWQLIVFPSNKKLMFDQYMRFKHRAFEEENHRI